MTQFSTVYYEVNQQMGALRGCATGAEVSACVDSHLCEGTEGVCVVCQEEFKPGEEGTTLRACGHTFHSECIEGWLLGCKRECPLCKEQLAPWPTRDSPLLRAKSGQGSSPPPRDLHEEMAEEAAATMTEAAEMDVMEEVEGMEVVEEVEAEAEAMPIAMLDAPEEMVMEDMEMATDQEESYSDTMARLDENARRVTSPMAHSQRQQRIACGLARQILERSDSEPDSPL